MAEPKANPWPRRKRLALIYGLTAFTVALLAGLALRYMYPREPLLAWNNIVLVAAVLTAMSLLLLLATFIQEYFYVLGRERVVVKELKRQILLALNRDLWFMRWEFCESASPPVREQFEYPEDWPEKKRLKEKTLRHLFKQARTITYYSNLIHIDELVHEYKRIPGKLQPEHGPYLVRVFMWNENEFSYLQINLTQDGPEDSTQADPHQVFVEIDCKRPRLVEKYVVRKVLEEAAESFAKSIRIHNYDTRNFATLVMPDNNVRDLSREELQTEAVEGGEARYFGDVTRASQAEVFRCAKELAVESPRTEDGHNRLVIDDTRYLLSFADHDRYEIQIHMDFEKQQS